MFVVQNTILLPTKHSKRIPTVHFAIRIVVQVETLVVVMKNYFKVPVSALRRISIRVNTIVVVVSEK